VRIEKCIDINLTKDSLLTLIQNQLEVDSTAYLEKFENNLYVISTTKEKYNYYDKKYHLFVENIDSIVRLDVKFVYLPYTEKKESAEFYYNFFMNKIIQGKIPVINNSEQEMKN
jgi:hypothetical protein